MTQDAGLPETNRWLKPPDFTLGERVTPEQAEFLETYGFIRFRGFASREKTRELLGEVREIERRLLAEGRAAVNGVPLYIGQTPDGRRYIQRLVFASTFGPRLHAFLQDPRLRGVLALAGPDFRLGERERDGLVVNHFRNEPGSAYDCIGWHTDSLRDLFYFEKPRRYLNVGFYLSDSPIAKGGLRLIPFSHRQSIWGMLARKLHHRDRGPDPAEYALEAEAGDLTIHDGRIWHRVARSPLVGEASERRVMYLPLMNGPEKQKHEKSPTPFYFHLRRLGGY
jgi:hypothetical protein